MHLYPFSASNINSPIKINHLLAVWRLTALWGFSEAAFGGILHALKIPFTGIFIGGTAVIIISLLAYFSNQKGVILRSTIIVILIKGLVSPHTPLMAYAAVMIQGMLGELFFFNRNYFKTSAFLLAVFSLSLSGLQKLLIIYIVFGNTFWDSINLFFNYILSQLSISTSINFSQYIITAYLSLHLIAGILIGIFSGGLPEWLIKNASSNEVFQIKASPDFSVLKREKKKWYKKTSGILFIIFSAALIILSFKSRQINSSIIIDILIMLLRAAVILMIWSLFLSPFLLRMANKFISKKSAEYSKEIKSMINIFPQLKKLAFLSWEKSAEQNALKRLKIFFPNLILFLLISDLEAE